MSFKSIVSQGSFWKSVVFLGIGFTIIYNIIFVLFEYGGFNFGQYYDDKIAGGKLPIFLFSQVVGAFLYGFILSYGQFRTKEKRNRDRRK